MPQATAKGVIYARFSPRKIRKVREGEDGAAIIKDEDGQTIECQIQTCRRYCELRGIEVVDVIEDPFESARSTPLFEREGGSRLASLPRGVTEICAAKLDRLFRDSADGIVLMRQWEKLRLNVHFADQGGNSINMGTPIGRMMVRTLLSIAEFEADMIADRTSQMMKHRQSRGERMTRKDSVPYGKMVDPANEANLIDNPEEIQVINEVRRLKSEEGRGLREICRIMAGRGLAVREGEWHPQKVKGMLG